MQTGSGQPLGTLNQGFVDRLVEGVSCFLLGGRAWAVFRIDHMDRMILVEPASGGRKPTWGGYLPQFLGFELCQAVLEVLTGGEDFRYHHQSARDVLRERREAFDGVLEPGVGGIEVDADEIRWWTFAGGRINGTLRYALNALHGAWKVVPDNYGLRVRGEHLDHAEFEQALEQLREPEFWENEELWAEVAASLPNYRLSKFQALMPEWVEREVVGAYLLDVAGARGCFAGR